MDLDLLSWNCRGICNDATTRALKDLISQNRPQIVFLCETKMSKEEDFERLRLALGFAHAEGVLSNGLSGGLGLFWSDEIQIDIGTTSAHHIDAVVVGSAGNPSWRITGFYGYASTGDRDHSWKLLRDFADLDSLPWVVIGDFNEILNHSEKIDGAQRSEGQMRGFREALGYGDLLDLGYHGAMTTWGNSETQLRLDRAVCTPSWLDVFNFSKLFHLPPSDSDHVPILLRASSCPFVSKPKCNRFKFDAFWLQYPECDEVVKNAWGTDVTGTPMFSVTSKIAVTRMHLDKWQKQAFRGRQIQMMGIRNRLEELLDKPASSVIQQEKKELMDRLQSLLHQEELFWRQRSKVMWLKEGDRNTGFFHRKTQNRRRKNMIKGLFDSSGQWQEDDEGVERVVTDYFSKMFLASEIDYTAVEKTLEAIQPCVSPRMNARLCAQYSREEIKTALFQMYPTKSPGPDGMPPLFFQHYWDTIGDEVCEAVTSFLHSGILLKQVNFTHICLIPKVDNPEEMSDLRPIALCNVIYKICSKAIANRLKIIMPDIISPFQSAFVPGRLITDNILVANEIAHVVHNRRDGREGLMALKLDLSKAYDRMEWLFLKKVMLRFGFAQDWIDVVMQCVTTLRYSFLVRGRPRGLVCPSRGLRQGDPLSPYLFLLGAEGFSALLRQKQLHGLLPGIRICRGAPSVNHLLFADDSMIYAQASLESCLEIQDVIDTYSRASGQLVNFAKSSLTFSKNVSEEGQVVIADFMGVEVVESHEKYLGLPTYVGRHKTATFQYIKEKLSKKLAGWQGKLLSGAGKDILIRVVAQALPTYAMSVFQLSKQFCEDLEQLCTKFWWGSTLDKRKIHWKTWDALCSPKEEGGLGFRSLSDFNTAMLAKQAWRVITNPSTLIAQLYKAKYFPSGSFWDAEAHSSPSFSWRSISSTKDLLKQNYCWQVGEGSKISIFSDTWVSAIPNGRPTASATALHEVSLVKDLMLPTGQWDSTKIGRLFTIEEAAAITSIPLGRRSVEDIMVWRLAKDGKFSVKSAYRCAFLSSSSYCPPLLSVGSVFWKQLWKADIPSKAKIHVWRVCLNILPSLESLASKRVQLDSYICALCEEVVESTLHLSRDCAFTKAVVSTNASLKQVCYHPSILSCDLLTWLSSCARDLSRCLFGELIFLLWSVWKERNERVWNNKSLSTCDVFLGSISRLQEYRYNNPKLNLVPRSRAAKWCAPSMGLLKINVDGSFNHLTRCGGLSFVVRDEMGCMLAGGACPLRGLLSPEHCELLACGRAIEFAHEHALLPAILEADALEVVRQLTNQTDQNTTVLGRLYDEIGTQLKDLASIQVKHIGRKGNMVAHCLASYACTLTDAQFFFSAPSFLLAALAADVSTL